MRLTILILSLISATMICAAERPVASVDQGAQHLTKISAEESKALKASQQKAAKQNTEAKSAIYKPKK